MSRIGDWFKARGEQFVDRWANHPLQQVGRVFASAVGGPAAGYGFQKGADAYNNSRGQAIGGRGQALGNAMQQALDQRIWGSQPQPMTENYGPWAGGYRGASMPQQSTNSMADALGMPNYSDQVTNSPSYGVQPQAAQQGVSPAEDFNNRFSVTQGSMAPKTPHPMGTGTSQGGGIGHGWTGTNASDAANFSQLMAAMQMAGIGGGGSVADQNANLTRKMVR